MAGDESYTLDMDIKSIAGDTGTATRGGVALTRMLCHNSDNDDATPEFDTPTAGVTFEASGDIACDVPIMAIDGEPLHAMVQNLGQTDDGYLSLGGTSRKVASQGFTTGSSKVGYRLQGIGVNVDGSDDSEGNAQVPSSTSSVSVAVHADFSNGKPGAKLFDLVNPGKFRVGHTFFEAPRDTTLDPNTSYVLVWSHLSRSDHRLQVNSSNSEDSGALTDFSIANDFYVGLSLTNLAVDSNGKAMEIAVYGADLDESRKAMVSNLGQTAGDYITAGPVDVKFVSQGFTTGSDSLGYRLQGIDVDIEGSTTGTKPQIPDPHSSVSVAVHADSSGEPGDKLFDLANPDEFAAGPNFFEAPPGTMLEPDTSYVLVWSYLAGTFHHLQLTTSDSEDSGGLPGFSIADSLQHGGTVDDLSAHTDGDSLEIAVYGVAEKRPIVPRSGYQVPRNWFHLPEGARVGDQFRLLFVTRGGTYATSGDIEDYNADAQWEPDQTYNDRFIRSVAPEFKAVVCTAAVDARTNTGMTDAVGVPVHWLDGGWDDLPTLVADSYAEFYGGEWVNHEWGAYVTGNSAHFNDSDFVTRYNKKIWTGCDARGVAHPDAHMGSTMGIVAVGTPGDEVSNHASLGAVDVDTGYVSAETDELGQIYVISPVLTVVP